MTSIAGVTTQTNTQGEITHVTFDMSEHGNIISPTLEQLVATKFDKMRREGTTVEESRKSMHQRIECMWKK